MIIISLLLVTIIPGLPLTFVLARKKSKFLTLLGIAGSTGLVWTTFYSYLAAFVGLSLSLYTTIILSLIPLAITLIAPLPRRRFFATSRRIKLPQKKTIFLSILIIFFLAIPLLTTHRQLPTGDIQKSIFWAQEIADSGHLPNYQLSTSLNRDPSDFTTPALHSLTSTIISLNKNNFFAALSWFSFFCGIILALQASSIASFFSNKERVQFLAFFFAATNIRFLRFVFYPGYHYQNLIGEIFLVTVLYFFLISLQTWNNTKNLKMVVLPFFGLFFPLLLLPFTHQFTAFLGILIALTLLATLAIYGRKNIIILFKTNRKKLTLFGTVFLLLLAVTVFFSPLTKKLSALFNFHPHLKPFTISLFDYPTTLGVTFFLLGLGGLIYILFLAKKRRNIYTTVTAVYCLLILFLGQGSKLFIDIPSARTLFYASLPLAIFAAVFLSKIIWLGKRGVGAAIFSVLTISLATATHLNTTAQQLLVTNHSTRVNASLTQESLDFLSFLKSSNNANTKTNLLIDDWNRRRLTWGILSPHNMLTRIGGDFGVIADESKQSDLRKSIYDNGLKYEKIFMLGNNPIVANLLAEQNISLIATAPDISASTFAHNPYLVPVFTNSETTVYKFSPTDDKDPDDTEENFLLEEATVANDVGDNEDTQAYTPLSLYATRISDPIFRSERSLREIQSVDGGIKINVEGYIAPLWDRDGNKTIDVPLKLLLRVQGNGSETTIKNNEKELTTFNTLKNEKFADIDIYIPSGKLSYDKKGFIDLKLNIKHGPLIIDLIAVGITKERNENQ